jgi:hypothetical protein
MPLTKNKQEAVPASVQSQAQAQDGPQVNSGPEDAFESQHRNQEKNGDARETNQTEKSATSSGGGAIFIGNVNAARDFADIHN